MSSAPGSPGPCVAATASISATVQAGVAQGLAGDGGQIAQMFAGGQFGNDAAIRGVQSGLAGDDVGEDSAAGNDRGAGFIA